MAYDAARERLVLFGGLDGSSHYNDTWEWDGNSWTDVTPEDGSPVARYGHAMAFSSRERVVLFGGIDVDYDRLSYTWEWDGASWTDVSPTGSSPVGRIDHALAYDSNRKRIVLFGGADPFPRQDTWEWDSGADQ